MDGDPLDPLFVELQTAVAGRYSLERELGRGGMGVVYLARDVTLDRPVAIKLLPPALSIRPGIKERFLREARTAARLSHPNIVAIHAVEDLGHLVCFVMAYVPGETLGARVRTGGPLPAAEVSGILRDVAWALDYAHQQGLVHRDVKADNILLDPSTRRTLVADFGIAAAAGQEETVSGTIPYMSPEQAGSNRVDGRSDLYSLGVVGYLALSGTLPYPAESLEQLHDLHRATARPLATMAPHVPRALCRAVDRCLGLTPDTRFQTAAELAAALDQMTIGPTELPAPLRVWLTRDEKTRSLVLAWTVLVILPTVTILIAAMRFDRGLGAFAGFVAFVAVTPWVIYGVTRLLRTRRVLAAGYRMSDLILAIRKQAEQHREELAFEIGSAPTLIGRWLRRATWTGLGIAVAMAAFPGFWVRSYTVLWLVIAGGAVGGAFLGMFIPGRALPPKNKPSLRERLWSGPIGQLVSRLAGWRLGRKAAPELTLHRPTEVALGDAAEALFQALPAEHRRELEQLPREIATLATEAQRLRREIESLDDLIAQAAPTTVFGERPEADGGAGALGATRAILAGQLQQTVALLEALRVGLLRLHAGTATPDAITADLATARDLGHRLGDLSRAHDELRELLGGPRSDAEVVSTG